MDKWEEWERIHDKQDARDRNIFLAVLALIIVLVIASNLTTSS